MPLVAPDGRDGVCAGAGCGGGWGLGSHGIWATPRCESFTCHSYINNSQYRVGPAV
jgi:hypothetical protein